VLVLGDLHIPSRENTIPAKFQRMLVPNKMQHVICTGNIGSKHQYSELRTLAPNIHVVSGDAEFDNTTSPDPSDAPNDNESSQQTTPAFPETRVVQVGVFRIGVVHGHQVVPWGDHMSLAMVRRKLGVDILISGHTHKNGVVEHEGFYHINPGSITGAFTATGEDATPSFVLLAVQGAKVVCYVYELIDGEVDVSKTEFSKQGSDADVVQRAI